MERWKEQNERTKEVELILQYARVLDIEEFENRLRKALKKER